MEVLEDYLFVQREDEPKFHSNQHYDYRGDFKTLKEAKEYASEASHQWLNHYDVVYAATYTYYNGELCAQEVTNLFEMTEAEQKAFCAEKGILYE